MCLRKNTGFSRDEKPSVSNKKLQDGGQRDSAEIKVFPFYMANNWLDPQH